MSIAFFSLIILALFMMHEFDEIVFVRPWIRAQGENPSYQNELFLSRKNQYLSTESIAFMIGEEFLLASLLLAAAAYFSIPELAVAILIGHLCHLLLHIREVKVFHRFTPGSFTALVTFPILCLLLLSFMLSHHINYILLLVMIPLVVALILGNLFFLYRKPRQINAWIEHVVK